MKKYILLAVFALVALASAAQTTEGDHLVTVLEDSIMQAEAEKQAYKDSVQAALDLKYAGERLILMADEVVSLDMLKYRPVLVVDAEGNYYATFGNNAVKFRNMNGRLSNSVGEQVNIQLQQGLSPEISFRNIRTKIAVDPATIK